MNVKQAWLLRSLGYASVGLVTAAVALGRWRDEEPAARAPSPVPYAWIGTQSGVHGRWVDLLDLKTARPVRVALPADDRLGLVSCAPWRDGRGEWRLVGCWSRQGADGRSRAQGLAQISAGGGRVLDRVEADLAPFSPPCWYPGTAARILYAGTDGALYQFAFRDGAGRGDPCPRVVPWRALPPGVAAVQALDVAWPAEPALGGRLLATLQVRPSAPGRPGARPPLGPPALWWLQLDPSGTQVVRAGPVARGVGPGADGVTVRLPAVGRSPDGRPRIAFLTARDGAATWRVEVAPLQADDGDGPPYYRAEDARPLAEGRGLLTPSFATDGRWVASLTAASRPALELIPLPPDLVASAR